MIKKIAKFPRIIFLIIFLLFYLITYFSGVDNAILRTTSAATMAFVLSPRKKKIPTQTGEKTQITWLFLKNPIVLD